jgi:acetyltransferase-like isoleucine patch superfamily enzyme
VLQGLFKYNSSRIGIYLRRICYRPFFKKFGKHIQIKDGVTFKFPSEIEIGDSAIIGEFSYFVGKGGLRIGANLLLAAGTKIITSSHIFDRVDLPIAKQGLLFEKITIGDDVWLGFDVKVFGNTNIGTGCVIGAGTIVKNITIPPYSVVVGTPGRIVKNRAAN